MLDKPIRIHSILSVLLALVVVVILPPLMSVLGIFVVPAVLADTTKNTKSAPAAETAQTTSGNTSVTITGTAPLSETSFITNTLALTIPASVNSSETVTQSLTQTETTSTDASQVQPDAGYSSIISGTIVANRTEQQALFFVEGATYLLDPLRSIGLQLPRSTAAVNLYNCDARTPEDQENCFWDPYLLTKDGFYEIVSGSDAGKTVSLVLREAGSAPGNKVFIQNRTGKAETVYYNGQEVEVEPASLREFDLPNDAPALIYLHSCISLDSETACEWAPRTVTAGLYYALVEKVEAGTAPNSQRISLELEEVLTASDNTPEPAAPQVTCRTLVPTLNVRSGPGLQYTIIQKVRISSSDPASVIAIGRDEGGQWLAVNDKIAPGGWVIASSNFLQCEGDLAGLPVVQPTIAELQPTPVSAQPAQASQSAASNEQTATSEETPVEGETPAEETPASAAIPDGYSLLVINNGYENPVRFTLDQRYRMELGPSEFDLQPGGSLQIVVIPGQIAFTASTPGRSGNADFLLEPGQTRVLWLTFVPDPGEKDKWVLQY